jgi:hypothetical protein
MKRRVIRVAIAAACTVVGAAVVTAQSRVQITGVYSDLRYNAQGGDLLGMEVFIVAGPGGYFATVQCASHGLGRRERSKPHRARSNGGSTEATVKLPAMRLLSSMSMLDTPYPAADLIMGATAQLREVQDSHEMPSPARSRRRP